MAKLISARILVVGAWLGMFSGTVAAGEPDGAASAFGIYSKTVETKLAEQRRPGGSLLELTPAVEGRVRAGGVVVERMLPAAGASPAGALLHDWRGTAFAPGAKAADFVRAMQNFGAYPQRYAPQVVAAKAMGPPGEHMQAWMRVKQKHVITVVMDGTYDVTFERLDARRGYSVSRSTRMEEIDGAGTKGERVLGPAEEHGFLWRMNTYWSYEERDGGLYLQVESVSLSRAIPRGLGWVVRPYVESIPKESLEFTLRSACAAVRK